jgi:hypothetical protein
MSEAEALKAQAEECLRDRAGQRIMDHLDANNLIPLIVAVMCGFACDVALKELETVAKR